MPAILVYPRACGMFIAASVHPAMASCKASAGLSRRTLWKRLSNHDLQKTNYRKSGVYIPRVGATIALPILHVRLEPITMVVSVKKLYYLRPERSAAIAERA